MVKSKLILNIINPSSSLFLASREGHLELAKFLVHNLSNVNQKNNSGYTSLHYGKKYYINY